MKAHRIDTKVAGDGSVTVRDLPFHVGEEVEVIILPRRAATQEGDVHTNLSGSVRRYERPFEAATDADEWDAA